MIPAALLLGLGLGAAASQGAPARLPAAAAPRAASLPLEEERPLLVAICALLAESPPRDERAALLLRRKLAALGPEAVPELFALLERVCDLSGEGEHAFEPLAARALAGALADLPADALRRHLEALAREATSRRTRECGLRLLAESGGVRELELGLALASAPAGAAAPSAVLAERALAALLARDAGAPAVAARAFERCSPESAATLVGAAARRGGEEALELLLYWLGRRPQLDLWILARACSLTTRGPATEEGCGSVRRALARSEPEVVALAARLCGRIGDDEAVELLLDLLEHEDEGVRTGAQLGLRALFGQELRLDAAGWRRRVEREREWWTREGARAGERLALAPAPEAAGWIEELSRRRLFRRRAAEAVAQALRRDEPDLLRLACAALGALRVRALREELEPLLAHREPGVREAATRAREALGGAR